MLILFLLLSLLIYGCNANSVTHPAKTIKQEDLSKGRENAVSNYIVGWRPRDIICADFNNDGFNDLATSLKTQSIAVLLNNGEAEFFSPVKYESLTHNTSITAADIDKDGDIDLIPLTEFRFGPIFLNDGKGGFTSFDPDIKAFPMSWRISSADLNNDTLPDFVVTSYSTHKVMLVMNLGDLTFNRTVISLEPYIDESIAPIRKRPEGVIGKSGGASPMGSKEKEAAPLKRRDSEKREIDSKRLRGSALPEGGAQSRQKAFPAQPETYPEKSREEQKKIKEKAADNNRQKKRPLYRDIRALKRVNGFKDHVITDIDGDGDNDILLPSYVLKRLYIGLNNGKGNFEFIVKDLSDIMGDERYTLSSVTIIRNKDGTLPLVAVAQESPGRIFIFNNNRGTLTLKHTIETKKAPLLRIVSDDMNSDGIHDIIAAFGAPLPVDKQSPVQIWTQDKTGDFILAEEAKSGGYAAYINTCRLLPDSPPSIVLSNIHESSLTLIRLQTLAK